MNIRLIEGRSLSETQLSWRVVKTIDLSYIYDIISKIPQALSSVLLIPLLISLLRTRRS